MIEVRRITVVLDKPTRDGDTEIHILTNLPARKVPAVRVAEIYRKRWTIEGLFFEVAQTLSCEIDTLCYPKAALFAFCLGLLACNAVALLKAALRAVHGEEVVSGQLSAYYLVLEIRQTYAGMMVAAPSSALVGLRGVRRRPTGAGAQRDRKPGSDPPLSQDAAWSQETTAPTKALQEWRALRHGKDYCRAAKSVTLEGLPCRG